MTGWTHGRINAAVPNASMRFTARRHVRGSCQSSMNDASGASATAEDGSTVSPRCMRGGYIRRQLMTSTGLDGVIPRTIAPLNWATPEASG